jgi:hypothetical protein
MTIVELRREHKVMTNDYVFSFHQASLLEVEDLHWPFLMGAKVGAPLVNKTSTLLPNFMVTKATIYSMTVRQALCSFGKVGISHR